MDLSCVELRARTAGYGWDPLRAAIFDMCRTAGQMSMRDIQLKLEQTPALCPLVPSLRRVVIDMVRNNHLMFVEGDSSGRYEWQNRLMKMMETRMFRYVTVHVPRRLGATTMANRLAAELGWSLLTLGDVNASAALAQMVDLCVNGQSTGIVIDYNGLALDPTEEYELRVQTRLVGFTVVDFIRCDSPNVSMWLELGNMTDTSMV